MSQENMELVTNLHFGPDVDFAGLFRDDDAWATLVDATTPFFHPDFETVPPGVPGTEGVYVGIDGFRAAWLGWMEPWLTYRTEVIEALDAGDRVLVLVHDYGRHEGSTEEVRIDGSGLWTVRDGKIARMEFFAHRSEAFEAAGLEE